jgi:hypothetical protein
MAVIKAGDDPEKFIIAYVDLQMPPGEPFMKTGSPKSEEDIRKELEQMGISQGDIDGFFQRAREQ